MAAPLAVLVGEMLPHAGEHEVPFCRRDQVTPLLLVSFETVAVNCWVVPGAMLGGFAGSTEIDATGDVVRVTSPLMLPEVAVIVVVPAETAVASPFDPVVSPTVAIEASNDSQVTDDVRFCLPPFEKVPCAVNCMVVPGAMLGENGLMALDTSKE